MIVGCAVFNFTKYDYSAQRDDYLTPSEIYEKILDENGLTIFDCDVCCSVYNVPARFHYKKDGLYQLSDKITGQDGLTGDWFKNNYCNPPFLLCKDFVKKASEEQAKGNTTFMLIPARTETKYWADYILDETGRTNRTNVDVIFLRKGLCFIEPDTGEKMPIFKNALALVTFRGIKNE